MSKQGDLAIENALTKLWDSKCNCLGEHFSTRSSDSFPRMYFSEVKDKTNSFKIYWRGFREKVGWDDLSIFYEICDFGDRVGHPEIRISVFSDDFTFRVHDIEMCISNNSVIKYKKLKRIVEKINNEFNFNQDYKLKLGLSNGAAGCNFSTTIRSYDNLEHHFRRFFDEAKAVFRYIFENYYEDNN